MKHHRLLLAILILILTASLTGCFGGRWRPKSLYGEPWKPSTVVPEIPAACRTLANGMYAGSKRERQQLPQTCGTYELRRKLALNNLRSEITQHQIQHRLDGIPALGGWTTNHVIVTHTGPSGGYWPY